MLTSQTINKIEEFVYQQPRSIQEIAAHLGKNWRTADRYTDEIEKNFGTISTKVFRGGTRGALKIVYWASVEKVSHSIFQEKLEQEILRARHKEDFSPFDIFQYVPDNKRSLEIQTHESEDLDQFKKILQSAKKQILLFSGNLSFINLRNGNKEVFNLFEKLLKKGISIKVLCRVDLAGKENIEKFLSLGLRNPESQIEIRHDVHPIRATIIDGKLARLKEIKEPTGKINELKDKKVIFYNITDKSWVDWLTRIFWKKFSNSLDATKRIEQLNKIRV